MPYIGKKPADIIATAVDTTTGTFSGAVSASSVDADGSDISLRDDGTEFGRLSLASSGLQVFVPASDADLFIKGNDGGSTVTALTLDMSDGGAATLNNGLTLSDGNIVVASGHGIDFSNASGSASGSTSALLDDYEEGEWTPQYEPASGSFGGSYLTQKGRYTKVGRKVTLEFQLVANFSNNTQSGAVKIIGLPFTVSAHSSGGSFHGLNIAQATRFTGDPPRGGQIQENSTKIFLWKTVEATGAGTDVAQLTTSNFILTGGNPNNLVASITYFAS